MQITPGTDGTLQETSVEATFWKWVHWLQLKEDNLTLNPNEQNRISGRKDLDTKIFEGTWSLTGLLTFQDGKPQISAVPYLEGETGWATGTGGTFSGENYAAYGIELITFICNKQRAAGVAAKVTANYNANSNEWTGTFRLPFTINESYNDTPVEFL